MSSSGAKSRAAGASAGASANNNKKVKKASSTFKHPLYEPKQKNFGIGGDVRGIRDLTRYVRWPLRIRLQRQKRVLMQRLKVPPAIHQFSFTLDKSQAVAALKFLNKYRHETDAEKKARLVEVAKDHVEGKKEATANKKAEAPTRIVSNIRRVCAAVENKRAKLVVIAHDVDPIETVVWLPALCRKMDVPYCIIKGKARLGLLVNQSFCNCLAITKTKKEDQAELDNLCKAYKLQFNDNLEVRRKVGGGLVAAPRKVKASKQEGAKEE